MAALLDGLVSGLPDDTRDRPRRPGRGHPVVCRGDRPFAHRPRPRGPAGRRVRAGEHRPARPRPDRCAGVAPGPRRSPARRPHTRAATRRQRGVGAGDDAEPRAHRRPVRGRARRRRGAAPARAPPGARAPVEPAELGLRAVRGSGRPSCARSPTRRCRCATASGSTSRSSGRTGRRARRHPTPRRSWRSTTSTRSTRSPATTTSRSCVRLPSSSSSPRRTGHALSGPTTTRPSTCATALGQVGDDAGEAARLKALLAARPRGRGALGRRRRAGP